MTTRKGHTPFWPEYFQYEIPDRRIAILEGKSLYVENIGRLSIGTLTDLVNGLFDTNSICFTEALTNKTYFPFLGQSVHASYADVSSNKDGWPLSVTFKHKNSTRWVVPVSTWDTHISSSFVPDMRGVFGHFDCVKPTPGAYGSALMRREWSIYNYQRYSSLNVLASDFLRKHGCGGRCDTLGKLHVIYPSLLEIDMASGYLAHFMKLPAGTSKKFLKDHCWQFATFFAKCVVTIKRELALGPFPFKKGQKIVYPTVPGSYVAYLWREEIEDCIRAGCDVSIQGGYGWDSYTFDTTSWCRYMYNHRLEAASDFIEYASKKIAVAAIGRLGMNQTFYHLIGPDQVKPYEKCVVGDDLRGYDYYIREEHDYKKPNMYHWFQYCIRECARTLYRYALPYAEQGRLIMTNYDSILVMEHNETHEYAEKHTLEAKMCDMGDWRWQRLTNVELLGDRSLRCDQKTVRPGVSAEEEAA